MSGSVIPPRLNVEKLPSVSQVRHTEGVQYKVGQAPTFTPIYTPPNAGGEAKHVSSDGAYPQLQLKTDAERVEAANASGSNLGTRINTYA